jgi:uncharacterized membrane protein
MAKVIRSVVIDASLEDVLAITEDPNRMVEWYVGVDDVRPDETFPEVGGTAEFVYKAAGITFSLQQTATIYDRGKHSEYELKGMISGTLVETLDQEGDSTRYTLDFDYQMPGGGVGKVVDKLVVERMNSQQLEQSLQNLKALAEA